MFLQCTTLYIVVNKDKDNDNFQEWGHLSDNMNSVTFRWSVMRVCCDYICVSQIYYITLHVNSYLLYRRAPVEVVSVTAVIASSTASVAPVIAVRSILQIWQAKDIVTIGRTRVSRGNHATKVTSAGTAVTRSGTSVLENVLNNNLLLL